MSKRVLLLTGAPGVGKTTVLIKTVGALNAMAVSVGGMVSREVRENGVRIGFEIRDLTSGRCGWLAHINQKTGPQVGKYHINIRDLEGIGANAIVNAVDNCDVVAIDEIGPMELFSGKFKEAARSALESRKLVLVVVHWKAQDRLILAVKNREDAELVVVTVENREKLPELLAEKAVAYLKHI